MNLKVFVKLKKGLKTLSSGQKTQKKPKKPTGLGFFKKKPGFFQPCAKWAVSSLTYCSNPFQVNTGMFISRIKIQILHNIITKCTRREKTSENKDL